MKRRSSLFIASLGLSLVACSGSSRVEPDASLPRDAGIDAAIVASGLDARPSNPSCLAPDRPPAGALGVRFDRVYPDLGFSFPLGLLRAPGDSTHWYVFEKPGVIRRFVDAVDTNASSVFLDLSDVVVTTSPNDERGLLGVAFHPDYETNGEVYVSYNTLDGEDTRSRLSRFVRATDGQTLDRASEEILLDFRQPATNHNGGDVKFGPDGRLYLALGDGGGGGDTFGHGQNQNSIFGAILRIDIDAGRESGLGYAIPEDNPFANGGGAAEIFAWGLRNPWRMSFDRGTGELWLADVGQGAFEEVDRIELGGNYGWPIREGFSCFGDASDCEDRQDLEPPVVVYGRTEGRSVTGGYVYRGTEHEALVGSYVFGDFVSGRVWAVQYDEAGEARAEVIADSGRSIASFAEDSDGELFVVDLGGGLYRMRPVTDAPASTFPARLSETGCVDTADPSQPAEGVIPYAMVAAFWSDGAQKERFLAIPDGTTIALEDDGDFTFPIGSVLMKHFRIDGRLVETRLFVRHDDGEWAGYSYAWNDAQTDADLLVAGEVRRFGDQDWIYPSRAECMTCHTAAAGRSLGPEWRQLDRLFFYESADALANAAETLAAIGLVEAPEPRPERFPPLADPDATLEARVRTYLHENCSNCHRPGGPGRGEFDLRFDAPGLLESLCGIDPLLGDLGISRARLIANGDPDRSVLLQRASRRDAFQMPPLGSNLVDEEGVALLRTWIESGPCP